MESDHYFKVRHATCDPESVNVIANRHIYELARRDASITSHAIMCRCENRLTSKITCKRFTYTNFDLFWQPWHPHRACLHTIYVKINIINLIILKTFFAYIALTQHQFLLKPIIYK